MDRDLIVPGREPQPMEADAQKHPAATMTNCEACGHENLPGSDSCALCGTDLVDPTASTASADSDPFVVEGIMREPIGGLIPGDPVCVAPDTTVEATIEALVTAGRACALVVWERTLVGIFTERDVLMRVASDFKRLGPCPVREFMTPAPETLSVSDTIAYALNRMTVGDFRHIPVERDEHPLGVVSVRDILKYLVEDHPEVLQSAERA